MRVSITIGWSAVAAIALGGASVAFAGCSSSSSNGGTGGSGGSGGSPSDAGGGIVDCGIPLHPHTSAGTYCPNVAGEQGDAAFDYGNLLCAQGQDCNFSPKHLQDGGMSPPSSCVARGTPANPSNAKILQCSQPVDCAMGQACCAGGTKVALACGVQLMMFTGTTCKASCAAGEFELCAVQADCTTGTCTEGIGGGGPFGFCL